MGRAADRRGSGQRSGPGSRRGRWQLKAAKKPCTERENRPEKGRRYKKRRDFPAFFGVFVVFQRVAECDLVAAAALQGMGATGKPSA